MSLAADLVFYLFAAVTVISALMVVASRNPVHSALWLITVFINGAGLFLLLNAEFLAMILIIVYAGAVAILFLFVVMMLNIDVAQRRGGLRHILPTGLAVGLFLLMDLFLIFSDWRTAPQAEALRAAPTPDLAQVSNTKALSFILYTDYLYLFQASAIVLLVAMIGAILLTFRRQPHRRQKVADQLARRKDETLVMNKVETGEGLS